MFKDRFPQTLMNDADSFCWCFPPNWHLAFIFSCFFLFSFSLLRKMNISYADQCSRKPAACWIKPTVRDGGDVLSLRLEWDAHLSQLKCHHFCFFLQSFLTSGSRSFCLCPPVLLFSLFLDCRYTPAYKLVWKQNPVDNSMSWKFQQVWHKGRV